MPLLDDLTADQVHVWVMSLHLPTEEVEELASTLAPSERLRAEAFDSPLQRRRFLCRRGLRRLILASYVGCRPAKLRLESGPGRKPELSGGELRFNCSSSGDVAVLALTSTRRVGVDVERLRPVLDPLGIARSYFTRAEHTQLRALHPREHDTAFLYCWIRKEAYVKAHGDGLGRALDAFAVSAAPPTEPTQTETVDDGPGGVWSLQAFLPAAGYAGAVAVEGQGWQARCQRW